jgi:hypothetical protein
VIQTDINTKLQDILATPERFGAPTFEEFAKNPEKYLGRDDELLITASEGAHKLKESNLIGKHHYKIFGYSAKSEDHVWSIMKNEGYTPRDFEIKPELVKTLAGQYDIHVEFVLKKEVPNAY